LPGTLSIQLSHKDVWLDFFRSKQSAVSKLTAGDKLHIVDKECRTGKGAVVLKFSRNFLDTIDSLTRQGYVLNNAIVTFVVWWKKEDDPENEIRIVLPQVRFVRGSD
jgi:ATP-dependent DNA helicase RecQ